MNVILMCMYFLLQQLSKCEDTVGMREMLDSEEFQFRFDAGVAVPSSSVEIEQINDIIHSLVMN